MKIHLKIDVGILIINTSKCVIIIVGMCTSKRGNSERRPKEATASERAMPKRGNSERASDFPKEATASERASDAQKRLKRPTTVPILDADAHNSSTDGPI
jgi:hypothetical protein